MDTRDFIDRFRESEMKQFSKATERFTICCMCKDEGSTPDANHFFPNSYMKSFFQKEDKNAIKCIETVNYSTVQKVFSKAGTYHATCSKCDKIFNESDTQFMETFKGKVELFVKAYCSTFFLNTIFFKGADPLSEIPISNFLNGLYLTLSVIKEHPNLLRTMNIDVPINGFYLSLFVINKDSMMVLIIAPKNNSTVIISLPILLRKQKSINYLYFCNYRFTQMIKSQKYNRKRLLNDCIRYNSILAIESLSMRDFRERMNETNPKLTYMLKNIDKECYYREKKKVDDFNMDIKNELIKMIRPGTSKKVQNKMLKNAAFEINCDSLRNPELVKNIPKLYKMLNEYR